MHETNGDTTKLWDLIKDIRIAMLTTVADGGSLHSRPMWTQEEEFDGTLWFFTDADSAKTYEIRGESHVNVAYADPDKNRYVAVAGRAQVVRDTQRVHDLWTPGLKAWFPNGPDDPSIALLSVDVDTAEYWDGPASTVVRLYGFAKALATGKRYEGEGSDHGKINL